MRVCVVGGGGREHALAHVLARTAEVVVAPGGPGMVAPGGPGMVAGDRRPVTCTEAPPEEVAADLFVIGPEAPLVDGMADRLRARGARVCGPGADGARLEASKAWTKELVEAAGVPTASYATFTDAAQAVRHLRGRPGPWVVKADGLAGGKGVLVTHSLDEACADVEAKLAGKAFGQAGRRVVIEEALSGPEVSIMALCDGRRALPLAPAQDFKRLGDGGAGPNTGGMGAHSPVPVAGADLVGQVMDEVVEPTVAALGRRGIDYRGVLYAGLMLTEDGPKLVEYNVRFGDPEAQAVLPRLDVDLVGLLAEVADGRLGTVPVFGHDACVSVVMAAKGYPAQPCPGDIITGVEEASALEGVTVFHAGTARDPGGHLVTAGGRVLDVTATGPTLAAARGRAYAGVERIAWAGAHWRRDIALEAAPAAPAAPTPTAGAVPEAAVR